MIIASLDLHARGHESIVVQRGPAVGVVLRWPNGRKLFPETM